MFDKVTIAYRGAKYEIGRGRDFYGIWMIGAMRTQPLEQWPETGEGWSAAWAKFASIEAPGSIVPVGRRTPPVAAAPAQEAAVPAQEAAAQEAAPVHEAGNPGPGETAAQAGETVVVAAGGTVPYGQYTGPYSQGPAQRVAPRLSGRTGAIAAAALLGAGVILGVAGLFPAYISGSSLTQQAFQLIPHVAYLATWAAGAVLILLGGARLRVGALLCVGLSVVTFGLFLADAATAIAAGTNAFGLGLVLSLLGWLACAAGSAVAFMAQPAGQAGRADRRGPLARPRGAELGPVVLLVLTGLGVAAAFAPAWDSFTLRTAAGQTQSMTAGNAFTNPGLVIFGDVVVMIAFVAVVIAAAFWRPVRHGAVLLAGAYIAMAAQAVSAVVQASGTVSPAQFGISSSEATQIGLTISSGLTPAFWIYCGFLVALGVSCVWMLFTPRPVPAPDPAAAGGYGWNAAAHDDAGDEEHQDEDADDDAAMPDFETAPRHTAGGAGDPVRAVPEARPAPDARAA